MACLQAFVIAYVSRLFVVKFISTLYRAYVSYVIRVIRSGHYSANYGVFKHDMACLKKTRRLPTTKLKKKLA